MNPQSPPPVSPAASVDPARWFTEEVHPHESSLRSFLRGTFPSVRDVDDVVQESYFRLWKARAVRPIQCARAFLFGIARRCAVDVIRKERRTSAHEVVMDFSTLDVLEETPDLAERLCVQQEIALLAEAIHALPPRCREIMILRKVECLPHREIARRLGISVATVEVQIYRGMEKCTRFLARRGVRAARRESMP